MQVVEHLGGVVQKARHLFFAEEHTALAQTREALPLNLFHHEIERPVLFEVVDVPGELRMRQGLEHPGFTLRQLDVLPAFGPAHVEPLDRDGSPFDLVQAVERSALRALAESAEAHEAPLAQRAVHVRTRRRPRSPDRK